MSFGFQSLYSNGINSHTQLVRAVDMVYQRGQSFEVVITGTTLETSLELIADLYVNDRRVSRMNIVPYSIDGSYVYRFSIRPYDILSNYIQSEHYTYYWLNDWDRTSEHINDDSPYPNYINCNIKYGYQYLDDIDVIVVNPETDYNHYTYIPACKDASDFSASGFTNTGNKFVLVGGVFQLDEKYLHPNVDQQLGTVSGSELNVTTYDGNRTLAPISQFLLDYPGLPEMSETARFLTDAPRVQYIRANENYVLHFLNGITPDKQVISADFVVFEFYDVNNVEVYYFEQEINKETKTDLSIHRIPCGPKDINNIFSNVDWNGVAYYRVQLFYGYPVDNNTQRVQKGAIGPLSECFYFYINSECSPVDTRLVWLNNRGGYDYYTFTSLRADSKKVERQTYDSRYYSTSNQSPDRNIARTLKTFDTSVTREFVLETDYLNLETANWLEYLFVSPQVYEMKEDFISPMDRQDKVYKDLKPLQVVSTDVEVITKRNRKLNKYRITVKYADSYFMGKAF